MLHGPGGLAFSILLGLISSRLVYRFTLGLCLARFVVLTRIASRSVVRIVA